MCIFNPDLDSDAIDAVAARLSEVITGSGGQVANLDRWGKRRLAYEIDNNTEGQYVVMTFSSDPQAPREIQRILNLDDKVIRHMVFRKDD